jgi:transposase
MAKKHPRAYPLEFRAKIVELARAGRRPEDLAAEFELSNQTIRNWIKQVDLDTGKRTDGLTSEERAELFMLRKKVKQLTVERERRFKTRPLPGAARGRAFFGTMSEAC